jgi:DNA-binding transcriptional LysR family regulator
MDRLDAMHLFVRVAELGSFSAVAQQIDAARSVVTRQIAALETHLGVKLLARSTRRLALTSAGVAYLEKCRMILDMVENAESEAAETRQTPRGAIRMSLPLSFGIRYLAPLLLEFAARYPEIGLVMDYSDERSNLFEEGLDLAIRISDRLEPGDVARKLGKVHLMLVAAPNYLAQHGEPAHPSELNGHECLIYTAAPGASTWAFKVDGQLKRFPVHGRVQANNGDVLIQAAISGLGLAYEPDFICADAINEGLVRPVLTEYTTQHINIYAVLPGNRHIPHRVRVLVDFMAERLATSDLNASGGA